MTATFADLGLDELLVVANILDACSVAALARCSRNLRRCLAPAAAARHEANLARARAFWVDWDRACRSTTDWGPSPDRDVAAHRQFWKAFGAVTDADLWRAGPRNGSAVLGGRVQHDRYTSGSSSQFTLVLDSVDFECRLHAMLDRAFVKLNPSGASWTAWIEPDGSSPTVDFFAADSHMDVAAARAALEALGDPAAATRELAARDHGDDAWLVARLQCAEHDERKAKLTRVLQPMPWDRGNRYAVRIMELARSTARSTAGPTPSC